MLSAFISKNQTDWDFYLPYLTMAYRSTVHESTKFTPNLLMLGREINLPVDMFIGLPVEDDVKLAHEWVNDVKDHLEDVFLMARKHLEQNQLRQKKYYDQHSRKSEYKVGSKV